MKLYVVIVTHNRPFLLKRTLECLEQCKLPHEYKGTFIIENGGSAESEKIVRLSSSHLNIGYYYESSTNKCRALNHVLSKFKNEFIVFFDDDIRFNSKILTEYVNAVHNHPDRHFFGGPVSIDYEKSPFDWMVPFLPLSAKGFELNAQRICIDGRGIFFLGFNWAAFADDIRRSGGFNTNFGPGTRFGMGDENLMQMALNNNNITGVYVPHARVWHYVPTNRCSAKWLKRRVIQVGMTTGALFWKNSCEGRTTVSLRAVIWTY